MLPIVKNFKEIVEHRDIDRMGKELYDFLTLNCGFIAHYDINGFKSTYKSPRDFAGVFIKHFDSRHKYYSGTYHCHESLYKETGQTKAQIKQQFELIVARHKIDIVQWAEGEGKKERYALFVQLKQEFEPGTMGRIQTNIENQGGVNHVE
jgi:hypothetical protein